jgi:hypothetical protein
MKTVNWRTTPLPWEAAESKSTRATTPAHLHLPIDLQTATSRLEFSIKWSIKAKPNLDSGPRIRTKRKPRKLSQVNWLSTDTLGAPKRRQGERAIAGGSFKNQSRWTEGTERLPRRTKLGGEGFDLPGSSKCEGEMGETGRSRKHVRVALGEEGRWKKSGGLASPSPAAWPWRSLSERCVWREKRREAEAGGENMLCPATAHGAAAPPPSSCRPPGWLVRRRWFCAVLAKNWRRQERTTRAWRPSSDYWNSFRKRRPFPVDFVGLLPVKED